MHEDIFERWGIRVISDHVSFRSMIAAFTLPPGDYEAVAHSMRVRLRTGTWKKELVHLTIRVSREDVGSWSGQSSPGFTDLQVDIVGYYHKGEIQRIEL